MLFISFRLFICSSSRWVSCSRALPAFSLGCCWPGASCCCLGAFG
ncbi:hypothetical protein NC651_016370 [Populus alba x Populus x berolinensis]|nr:hypothetical protein NC651_016370 [Populus alba x Populus x berolinensis]